ncbi:MAG: cobalamin-dependent protein [Deltaproteobacteria bacterium]|nr:cobalamin-dependent protein [Deltaproteobacteria bacterium]
MKRKQEFSKEFKAADLTRVAPYGDTLDDGQVQAGFSLPVPLSDEAREAAKKLAMKMGLTQPSIYHAADLGEGFSYYIVYGKCRHTVDVTRIVIPRVQALPMNFDEINDFIRERIGRKVSVIGGCTGTDAHTVGIDAIMNMKGYAGEYGLERYPMVNALNIGSQITNEEMLARAIEFRADAVLISQVVTQKDVHLSNLAEFVDMVEAEGIRDRILLICGGPRITHEVALELGFDAGFGPNTLPPQVASFIAQEMANRGNC